jgi:hypothetical protein
MNGSHNGRLSQVEAGDEETNEGAKSQTVLKKEASDIWMEK